MTGMLYVCAICIALFAATCFVPVAGIPVWGFVIAVAVALWFFRIAVRFLRGATRRNLFLLRKTVEYLPFVLFACFIIRRSGEADGTFLLDLVSVVFWLLSSIAGIVILYRLSDKRIERYLPGFPPPETHKRSLGMQALEWVDALLQAACLVLLINLFIFQLYAIPSESMVPEFMVGDRVVVVKTPSGPKFPLSKVGIPRMRDYKRGDIVVFSNPHYNDTKADRVRSFASQLVYMVTFTAVNINRDEYGAIKADPLVKRITGVPGEKLLLVDGVLYSKRAGEPDFSPVLEDASWAAWNIDALPQSEKAQVRSIPLSREKYDLMVSVESTRANLDLEAAAAESAALVDRFASLRGKGDTVTDTPDLFPRSRREIVAMYQSNAEITRTLLTTNGGLAWFRSFMTDWAKSPVRSNLFDDRSMRIDVLLKLDFGRLVVRNAELFAGNATVQQIEGDSIRNQILAEAESYHFYMLVHDQRNMGAFPAGMDEYIPQNCYFMMGDNRFNSLDMRHSYEVKLAPIDPFDPYSFVYRSNLAPQYVGIDRILGTATFRFWPLSRAGIPR